MDELDELEAQLDRLDREAEVWSKAFLAFQVVCLVLWLAFGAHLLLR